MIEYLSPGIYFQEAPIEMALVPVATATAGFVGYAAESAIAEPHRPVLVTNWSQFCDHFGDADGNPHVPGCYLAHAVRGFFDNGGTRAFIVRVPKPEQFDRGLAGEGLCLTEADVEQLIGVARQDVPEPRRRGMGALVGTDEISLVAIPDLMAGLWQRDRLRPTRQGRCPYCGGLMNGPVPRCYRCKRAGREVVRETELEARLPLVRAAQTAMVEHCEDVRYRIAMLDPVPAHRPQAILNWVQEAAYPCRLGHATYYYPWVQVKHTAAEEDRMVPPCGHIAGVWARSDSQRGFHQSPANMEIEGALDVEWQLTEGEQHMLNPHGINCVRSFPGRGIHVWGARTLASNESWKYLAVRRLLTFIEKSIERNTQWAVFEPNTPALWGSLSRFIGAWLTGLWRQGRLAGATPEQGFFVKCDEETNPPESRELGRVMTLIGVAPLKPAEFIVFRVQQSHGAA